MKEKTKKIIRWLGATLVCVALAAAFAFMFVTKCVLGISSISQNSLYCYLCVNANIRRFPSTKVEGEVVFNVSQVSDHNHPAYNEMKFVTKAAKEEVEQKSNEYLNSIEFSNTSKYKTSVYEDYIWFESKKSYIGYKVVPQDDNQSNKVFVVEQFKDDFLK